MASSSRLFAGGNEDGEVFAFALNGLSSGTFNDPVVKFPSEIDGAPGTVSILLAASINSHFPNTQSLVIPTHNFSNFYRFLVNTHPLSDRDEHC